MLFKVPKTKTRITQFGKSLHLQMCTIFSPSHRFETDFPKWTAAAMFCCVWPGCGNVMHLVLFPTFVRWTTYSWGSLNGAMARRPRRRCRYPWCKLYVWLVGTHRARSVQLRRSEIQNSNNKTRTTRRNASRARRRVCLGANRQPLRRVELHVVWRVSGSFRELII